VNFVTCHDGFTLNDLVSYDRKHNEANQENNCDGVDDNRSHNWGFEGPTDDPAVERLRNRQVKNFRAVTMLSLGLPMFLMGDEMRRTQYGNNNAYCQDNETSWFDWALLTKHADIHRFAKLLCAHRLMRDFEPEVEGLSLNQLLRQARRDWHGVKLGEPDWSVHSHSLAYGVACANQKLRFYAILNAYWESLEFELPSISEGKDFWHRWIDTSLDSPYDIAEWQTAPAVKSRAYLAGPRAVVALFAWAGDRARL
jgi:isoamylase